MKSNDFQIINENWQKFISPETDEQLLEWFYETYEKNMLLEQSGGPSEQDIAKLVTDIQADEKAGTGKFKKAFNALKKSGPTAIKSIGGVVLVWYFTPAILDGMLTGLEELVRWWALEGKSDYNYLNEQYFKKFSYYYDKVFGFSNLSWGDFAVAGGASATVYNMVAKSKANTKLQQTQKEIEELIDSAYQKTNNKQVQNRLANGKDFLMQQVREINIASNEIENVMKDIGGIQGEPSFLFKVKRFFNIVKVIPIVKNFFNTNEKGKEALNNYRTVYNILKPELRSNLLKTILALPEDKLIKYLDTAGNYDIKTMALKPPTTTAPAPTSPPEGSLTTSQPIGSRVTQALRKRET
jgi:hypothetical protein